MKLFILLLSTFISVNLSAQTQTFQWAVPSAGEYESYGAIITIDSLSNVYKAGYFNGTMDFDPGPGVYNLTTTGGGTDAFVSKFNTSGNFIWAKRIGGASTTTTHGNSVAVDKFGDVYMTGTYTGIIDFDPSVATYTLPYTGNTDIFVLKLDSTGNFIWAKNFGGTVNDRGLSIAVDNSGNAYATGTFDGTVDFDPGPSIYNLVSGGNLDVYICKLDVSGNFVWAKQIKGVNNQETTSIELDIYGNIYTTGYFQGTPDFDSGPGVANLTSTFNSDVFILKLDNNGNYKWVKGFGSSSWVEYGASLKIDVYGSVYTTGWFGGTVDFDPSGALYPLTSSGSNDVFISKLDMNGNFVWAKKMGGTGVDQGNSIDIDASGNVYTTGMFVSTVDFDPGAGIYSLTSSGQYDIFISKLDINGNFLWAKNIGNTNNDYGATIKLDVLGNIYSFGIYSGSNVDFDIGAGVYNLPAGLSRYIHKISQSCDIPLPPANITPTINTTICAISQATLSTANLGTVNWYASSTSSTVIGTGYNFVTPILTTGTYTFYAETVTCTVSASRTAIPVTVNPSPTVTVNSGTICSGQSFAITPGGANTYSFSGGSAVVSPTASTNYTVIGTAINNCSNTAISTVTVNPLPTFTLSGPANTITCLNSSTSFTVNTADNIFWTGPGTINPAPMVATPFVNTVGIYTVTVTDANLCSNTGTVEVIANVTVPVVNVNAVVPVLCDGGSTAVFANSTPTNGVSYLWNNSATTQSISVSPTVTTVYTATVTDNTNGCYTSNSTTITVYPIPTLTVTGTNTVCLGTSTGFIALGATTYTWNTGQTTTSISVNPTSTTIYTVWGTDMNGCINSETVSLTVDNTCADVWPGDANSDGVADNLDVLELGLRYTQTGPTRASISNAWQSYFANNWTGTITNGSNLNHSDCNGDGVIDNNDTLAIFNNYGLMHTFKPAQTNTVNPQLSIVPDQPMVTKGTWGTASVYLGDAGNTISNINGIAFTVDFDNTLIEPSSVWIEYQNSFIDAGQNLHFRKLDFTNNKLFTASTHTVSNNVSGSGKIAVLHYQILSSLLTDQVLSIGASQVNQSDASGTISSLTSGTGTLMAIGASVGLKENVMGGNVLISPNPTNGILNISFNSVPQNTKIEVYNSIGALILTETMSNKNNTINISDLSRGIYFMKVLEGNKVIAVKKVVKE